MGGASRFKTESKKKTQKNQVHQTHACILLLGQQGAASIRGRSLNSHGFTQGTMLLYRPISSQLRWPHVDLNEGLKVVGGS